MRQHAIAQRRLDQIYDVDPIEAPTKSKDIQALPIRSRFPHRRMQRGRRQVGLWPAMRRSPAAEHLAAPPVARQQLRTARNALKVCSTVPASDYAGIATIAPPPEPREATCECVETRKRRLNGRTLAEACVRLSSLSHSSVRQSVSSCRRDGESVHDLARIYDNKLHKRAALKNPTAHARTAP